MPDDEHTSIGAASRRGGGEGRQCGSYRFGRTPFVSAPASRCASEPLRESARLMATAAALEAVGSRRTYRAYQDHRTLADRRRLRDEDLRVYGDLVREGDGIPPTTREFTTARELSSTSVAMYRMRRLEKVGWLYTPPALLARMRSHEAARAKTLTPAGWERYRELIA